MSFKEIKKEYNEMAKSTVHILESANTGMRIVYFENDSDEYFFSFCFPTLPSDDKGKPHIVEHAVLSGSTLYPYIDPFMKADSVSVNTFMNALTMLETTLYPTSSKVYSDFKQLFEIYADAVFSPLLTKEAFKSEGVERIKKGDKIELKGVVLSEMLSDNFDKDTRSETILNHTMFKSTPYRFNSGGEPKDIASLTYKEFLNFYKKHYSFSNCTLVLYGKPNILECIDILENRYLSKVKVYKDKSKVYKSKNINDLNFYKKPKNNFCYYQSDNKNNRPSVSIHFLSDIKRGNPCESWMMTILEDILLGNVHSPLSDALLKSKLGEDISALSGVNRRGPYSMLSFGIDDFIIKKDETKKALSSRAEKEFLKIINEIIDRGIDEEFVRASLKYYEFKIKEGPIGDPYGLYLTRRILPYVIKETDNPLLYLNASECIKKIKTEYDKDKNLFVSFLKKHFIDVDKHSLIVAFPSDSVFSKDEIVRCKNALSAYKKEKKESEDSKESLNQKTDKPIEISRCVNGQTLKELFRKETFVETYIDSVPVIFNKQNTNEIYYLNVFFDVSFCTHEELKSLSFLSSLISHIRVGNLSSEEFSKKLLLIALGFSVSVLTVREEQNGDKIKSYLLFRAKVLKEDVKEYFSLLSTLIFEMKCDDKEGFENAIIDEKGTVLNILNRDTVSVFINTALSVYSNAYFIKNQIKGVPYFKYINALKCDEAKVYESLLKKVFLKDNLNIFLTGEKDEEINRSIEKFINNFTSANFQKVYALNEIRNCDMAYAYPFGNFYNAISFKVSPQVPSFDLYSSLLDSKTLYPTLRRLLSSYGCGSIYLDSGEFCVYSLSDPGIETTFDAFERCFSFDFNTDEIEDALIKNLKNLASVPSIEEKASLSFIRYISKLTNEQREKNIDALLNTSKKDINEAMNIILNQKGKRTTFGDEKALKRAYNLESIEKIL